MPVSKEILDEIALSPAEYQMIVDRLDREPNPVELGMFGALWSEHCGYKHSRPLLGMLPSTSARTLSQAGAENAGAIDIGDGLAVVFKVESHNHPSAVEPLQGAATGVGGIVRDILAMGARPIALLNSLRFGPPYQAANRRLLRGVVDGIGWYGNCIGVPDVAGEIFFDESYSQNPLVNAMCVGIAPIKDLASAAANTPGDVLLLVGAGTGRDGIHGASGLASRTFEEEQELRPTVQVANPFLEKVLIEACLEALGTGKVRALQDLGAAGLTSAAVESVARGERGFALDISLVHRREEGMTGYEVMLSESQERMLLVAAPEHVRDVSAVFEKWDVPCRAVGVVTEERVARVTEGSDPLAAAPVPHLADAPRYRLMGSPSPDHVARQHLQLSDVPLPPDVGLGNAGEVLLRLLASPNIASKRHVYRQYDHQVQTNTVVAPGAGDAAVLRVKGTGKAIAVAIDGNGRQCFLDPYQGAQRVVAEVTRNLSCVGAEPLALTDCLNFGNPERPDIYYQLEGCISGMADACRELGVPVVSGNVSLYNESQGAAIFPTPIVGGLGLVEDARKHCGAGFPAGGLAVVLVGAGKLSAGPHDLAGSEYLSVVHGLIRGRPQIDLALEQRVQELCRRLIADGVALSAHDCSDGGFAVALAESCILGDTRVGGAGPVGFTASAEFADSIPGRWDAALFGEAASRILVSVDPSNLAAMLSAAQEARIPACAVGETGGDLLIVGSLLGVAVADLADSWYRGLSDAWI
ncbi:MAG: phosphoribosylformylglycinamidine synthase subunit PurL [Chloroflexota bacterium]|nr:phosphoribosylformylglycinamidine synthase subunit PurL [Chloroflexota bacterium]